VTQTQPDRSPDEPGTEVVGYRATGHVAVITLNRPEARNAVNGPMAAGVEAAIDRIEEDTEIRAAVLAAAPPVFCAGADLRAMRERGGGQLSTERGGFAGIIRRLRSKPIIAAVDGPALAGGCEIVLACDLVVASGAASFGLPEVKRSLIAGAGGLLRLPRKIPVNVAMEVALTGDPISAERAASFGLVNELCAPGAALERAVALAERVAANAPVAVRESRRVLIGAGGRDDEAAWELSRSGAATVLGSADFREGVAAFLEKRPPRWTGT
jgi:enoyl-CoA hydratase